ncbi:hypothetical protein [Brevibacterium sediminis]
MPQNNKGLHLNALHEAAYGLFGEDCDMPTIHAMIGAVVGHQLGESAPWLNIIGAASGGKTERIWPLEGLPNVATASNISSEGALLSATSSKERTDDASGGLLMEIGNDGILVIKDVTSILSMSGDRRQSVLAALREVYDGEWTRKVGTDGGKSYTWTGHCTVIGAVTEIWDSYHSVIAQMGDRFMLIRLPAETKEGRKEKARRSALLRGTKKQRLSAYRNAVLAVVGNADVANVAQPSEDEVDVLVEIADQTTRLRTPVESDWRGDAISAPTPEGIYRFLNQLQSLFLGMCAAGIDRTEAMNVCRKIGHDSVPPRRMRILEFLAEKPSQKVAWVSVGADITRSTTYRDLEGMRMQGLVRLAEDRYSVGDDVDLSCFEQKVTKFCSPRSKGTDETRKTTFINNNMGMAENGHSSPQVTPLTPQETDPTNDDDNEFYEALESLHAEGL